MLTYQCFESAEMRRSVLNASRISKCLASSYGGVGWDGIPKGILPSIPINVNYSEVPKVAPPPSSSKIEMNERPSHDQLLKVYNSLQNSLPKLFVQPMDYSVYSVDVVFINNIRNKTTHITDLMSLTELRRVDAIYGDFLCLSFRGIVKYVQQVALLRTIGHLKFAYVKLEVLNMNLSEEECRITVRWRIRGISGLRVILRFWKFKLWKWKEIMDQQEDWYDGISYFDVGPQGTVYRHIADKVMEDKERLTMTSSKAPLAAKMGVLAALLPHPGVQDLFMMEVSLMSLLFHSQVPTPSRLVGL